MSDIEIEIDGKTLKAQPNSMVIQVADEAGIYIPRFCYHKHLSIAANCRMCLVEVEKAPKPLPACATPVAPGMKVFTRSPKALAAQKAVMEFLLINHPLDCPVCDQGGECELQDLSLGYGSADSYYTFGKRSVADKDIGPLVETEMTRCIQCTRCVRFGDEIAGMRELGAVNRGEDMEITTYIEKALHSELSGNIIDLCPVGALTSKPFRFTARAWELNQYPTVAAHDCIGSNLYAHTRGGRVMRMVPHEKQSINQTWLSDRDRFSYEGLYHADRLTKPMIRVEGEWREADWQTALEITVAGLRSVITAHGAEKLGALASPNSTLEEFYLLQKLMRQLGSNHIDHRLRQTDFSDQDSMPAFPGINADIADIAAADVIILIGSDIQREQPIAGMHVRAAHRKGAKVIALNMMDYRFNFPAQKQIVAPQQFVNAVAGFAKAVAGGAQGLEDITVTPEQAALAQLVRAGKNVCVLVGAPAMNHPEAAQLRALASIIASACGSSTLGFLTEGANAAGAWLAGAIPHRTAATKPVNTGSGLDAQAMWSKPRKGYALLNIEPDLDCANAPAAMRALEQAEFIVAFTAFKNPVLMDYAKVLLPVTPFTETAGTFVNASGTWQRFNGVATPEGESRPAWKVLRVLGNLFHCEGFDYNTAHEISDELKELIEATASKYMATRPKHTLNIRKAQHALSRVGDMPLYAGDHIQRRAKALQATQHILDANLSTVRLHPETAKKLNIATADAVTIVQAGERVRLPVVIDERVALDAAYIPGGVAATSALGELYGPIEIHKP